ncbi:MAG: hypothetical protein K2X87_04060 [Gemmataceae bacterium]|nr:hypothetical protein [Gemmataceae bacterium]
MAGRDRPPPAGPAPRRVRGRPPGSPRPFVEIDIGTYEQDAGGPAGYDPPADGGAAAWAATLPVVAVETELPDYDEYEVRIYDATRGRTLVATIELVSPGNKDRPEKRNAFVGKCAALLQKGVAVSVVDLITARHTNLFADLLGFVGHGDLNPPAPAAVRGLMPVGRAGAGGRPWRGGPTP